MSKTLNLKIITPVILSFFVMGMVDLVGVSTNFSRKDFSLDDLTASVLPMMVFLWFAAFSIPTGMIMSRIGRKRTALISIFVHLIALLLAFSIHNLYTIIAAFALLGIGNTMLQVSLNPLVADIVSGKKLTGTLTFGQFIKAIASFLGPIIATQCVTYTGNWKFVFLIYAAVSLSALLWLFAVPVKEKNTGENKTYTSFSGTLAMLKSGFTSQLFLGILLIVGIDVCMNTNTPQLLIQRLSVTTESAGLGSSLYFGARTVGAFLGSMILIKVKASNFFKVNMIVAIIAFLSIIFITDQWLIYGCIFLIGFTCANVFSIIFSIALQYKPDKANEISSLMIMGVAGGAVVTPIMGLAAKYTGIGFSFGVLLLCAVYLFFLSLKLAKYD